MIISQPMPFREAINSHATRTLLGTDLNSLGMRGVLDQLPDDLKRRFFFSSRVDNFDTLDKFFGSVKKVIDRQVGDRDPRTFIREGLADLKLDPQTYGQRRLDIMLETNEAIATAIGNSTLAAANVQNEPAFELVKFITRKHPRGSADYTGDAAIGWEERWTEACDQTGDEVAARVFEETGRMIAFQSSPVWHYLATAWEDALGLDEGPYAWGTGWGRRSVARAECVELGMLQADEEVKAPKWPELNQGLKAKVETDDTVLLDALQKALGAGYTIQNGILRAA